VVKRKKPVKKKTQTLELAPGLEGELETEVPNFSDLYGSWKEAAESFTLNTGRTSTNILEFINNMGVKGRAKASGDEQSTVAPTQQYIDKAKNAGQEEFYSKEQVIAIQDLKKYLDENNTATSKINPQNIKFNGIADFNNKGKITDKVPVFGDFRTPMYVKYRRRHKGESVTPAKSHWYEIGADGAGKAKPPVWQALFAENNSDLLDFKHPSLLMMCNMVIEAIPNAKVRNTSEKPFNLTINRPKVRGEAAKWVYENLSGFKNWFDTKIKDTSYHYSTGNINDKKLRNEILRTSFKLSDNESKKLQAWLQTDVTVDLENVHMMISNRQIKNMAEIAGFKNTKTEEKVEKQDFSDWRQIVKMVQ